MQGVKYMKVKALKHFNSAILNAAEGEIYDVGIDDYTLKNWVENGLIEEVKVKVSKKKVTKDED